MSLGATFYFQILNSGWTLLLSDFVSLSFDQLSSGVGLDRWILDWVRSESKIEKRIALPSNYSSCC
jgi:hypothetical protein